MYGMAKELHTSAEVLKEAASLHLYQKLVVQLTKDFALASIPFYPQEGVSPDELKVMLREKIYVLLLERFQDYLNLLYIIDVPETSFSKGETKDAIEMADEACYLILKREWQKVWLRQSYGEGG